MENELIIEASRMEWGAILKMLVVVATSLGATYAIKRWLDAETWSVVFSKLCTVIMQVEQMAGPGNGTHKLTEAVKLAETILNDKERKLVSKKGLTVVIQGIFDLVVKPIMSRKLKNRWSI